MAINSTNGKNLFDPSRRIKAALGEEYSSNLQGEAIARLSQAMASNGIRRSATEYNEEDQEMRIRDLIKNRTTHTNPVTPQMESISETRPTVEENSDINPRISAVNNAELRLASMVNGKSVSDKIVRGLTGFGGSEEGPANKTAMINLITKNISSFVVNDMSEFVFRYHQYIPEECGTKAVCTTIGAAATIDAIINGVAAGNSERVRSLFDEKALTDTESKIINKTLNTERLKYGIEHALASVVVPAAVKYGIDKSVGDKYRNNAVFGALTSFGVLSEVGKLTLHGIRKASEKAYRAKLVARTDVQVVDTTTGEPLPVITEYKNIAKLGMMHTINETIDVGAIGSLGGSCLGYSSVVPQNNAFVSAQTASKVDAFRSGKSTTVASNASDTVKPVVKSSTKKSA